MFIIIQFCYPKQLVSQTERSGPLECEITRGRCTLTCLWYSDLSKETTLLQMLKMDIAKDIHLRTSTYWLMIGYYVYIMQRSGIAGERALLSKVKVKCISHLRIRTVWPNPSLFIHIFWSTFFSAFFFFFFFHFSKLIRLRDVQVHICTESYYEDVPKLWLN